MNIKENQNDFIIIIINNSKKPKEIFFPEEKLSLGCEPIKNGFYKFIILDHDNDSIEYNKNNNSAYDKMNINKEKNDEGTIIDKENSKKNMNPEIKIEFNLNKSKNFDQNSINNRYSEDF